MACGCVRAVTRGGAGASSNGGGVLRSLGGGWCAAAAGGRLPPAGDRVMGGDRIGCVMLTDGGETRTLDVQRGACGRHVGWGGATWESVGSVAAEEDWEQHPSGVNVALTDSMVASDLFLEGKGTPAAAATTAIDTRLWWPWRSEGV